jgi:hypothetical protein
MLAVVIPYFKITYFEKTLSSLSRQTCKKFRVYIGNDNSPEDPELLIESFKSEMDITYRKFSNNLGSRSLTKQWDRCINLVEDEKWIMILGDDDFISDNYIEAFYDSLNEIKELKVNLVRFASQIVWDEIGKVSKLFKHPKLEKSTDFFYRKFVLSNTRSSLSEYIFKKDIYKTYGFRDYPLGWGSDNIAWLEFSEFGNIFSINTAIAYIRMSSRNLSRSGFGEKFKAEAKFQYFKFLISHHLNQFSPNQRLDILEKWEIFNYKHRKVSLSFWLDTSLIYISEGRILEAIKFQRRTIINVLSQNQIEE